ncbi:hypothetical protein [Nonomuraea helvata]|uniref:Uncharacterized protein n=1 Tax=Nonomuraea helvata TaxID=37484 RepID=A0ABV5S6W6_9ACTN
MRSVSSFPRPIFSQLPWPWSQSYVLAIARTTPVDACKEMAGDQVEVGALQEVRGALRAR